METKEFSELIEKDDYVRCEGGLLNLKKNIAEQIFNNIEGLDTDRNLINEEESKPQFRFTSKYYQFKKELIEYEKD